jgi:hypothetical protein
MSSLSYSRHRFPIDVIQQAVWLYFRFPLSFRDVEDLLTQRGIGVSYETVRRWSVKFGLAYARKLRRSHPGVVTLSQIERKLPTIANFDMSVFTDLVEWLVARTRLISLNVTTPCQQRYQTRHWVLLTVRS